MKERVLDEPDWDYVHKVKLNLPRFHWHLLRRLRAAFVIRPIGLLELGRAHVAQRRVDPRAVVHHLDVLEDAERDEYPPLIKLEAGDDLKITNNSFKRALRELHHLGAA